MLSKSKRLYLSKEFDIKDPLEKDEEIFIEELCKRACTNERFLGRGVSRMVFDLGENLILKVNAIYGKYATRCNGNGVDIEEYLEKTQSPRISRYYTTSIDSWLGDLPINERVLKNKNIDDLTDFFFNELSEEYNDQTLSEVSNSKNWADNNCFAKIFGYSKNYSAVVMEKCISYSTIYDYFCDGIDEIEPLEVSIVKAFYKEKGWNQKELSPFRTFINEQRKNIGLNYNLKDLHMGNFGISMNGDFKIFDYAY